MTADHTYSNQAMATQGLADGGVFNLRPSGCPVHRDAYRNRNVVERCFGKLKEYRRIATRYDNTARNYLAMVKLGCIRIFYKRLCN